MDYFHSDHLEYLGDDYYDFVDFEDNPFLEPEPHRVADLDSVDSDIEDDFESSKSNTDTSAVEARNGKIYREFPGKGLISLGISIECLQVEKGKTFYDFQFNTRLVKSTIVHFQLRNLIWATSKHDVYLMQNYSVMHWSSLLRRGKEVLNVATPIVPTMKRPGLLSQSLSRVQISTMAVKENLLVAGFQGELICRYLNQPGVAFCTKVTTDENAITNAVNIYHNHNGLLRIMTANNDAAVRVYDAESFACVNCFSFDCPGDSTECLIIDASSGKITGNLKGHLDYSFASVWHPDGRILATGNQDTTCRLWDIRNLSKSLAMLKGNMGAIRALRFTSDGRFLAMAEPADFVHVFDAESGYVKCQEIDIFGEIAGISFSPDAEALFVGVADRTYGSLLEFNRTHYNCYLDSVF
ncbi:hypothetical protein GH714_002180 [Hevea brasiliensis]|uniref:Uncharacterized protein n=1 Tax=Hevea brasiliensis TaxID=3981 RepID=A0A6A6LGJ4_HEVBR|nr:hypothetical protein GH714_002180 [Hevea brasiliensis]